MTTIVSTAMSRRQVFQDRADAAADVGERLAAGVGHLELAGDPVLLGLGIGRPALLARDAAQGADPPLVQRRDHDRLQPAHAADRGRRVHGASHRRAVERLRVRILEPPAELLGLLEPPRSGRCPTRPRGTGRAPTSRHGGPAGRESLRHHPARSGSFRLLPTIINGPGPMPVSSRPMVATTARNRGPGESLRSEPRRVARRVPTSFGPATSPREGVAVDPDFPPYSLACSRRFLQDGNLSGPLPLA